MARIPYVDPEDLPEEHRDLVVSEMQREPRNIYRALANNPTILAGFQGFLSALWADSGLSERERELVILAMAREMESEYEWHQHVRIARDVGVTDDRIRAVSRGDLDALGSDLAALVGYARAVARGEVDDDLHEAIADLVDPETMVGVAMIGTTYPHVARLLEAFDVGLEPDESFVGWELENE